KHKAQSTKHKAQSTKHKAQSTKHKAQSTKDDRALSLIFGPAVTQLGEVESRTPYLPSVSFQSRRHKS
ncbi:MAG: hypothetical protein V7760_12170, partial [Marinobacter sp.]